jgi:hypothetical protein
MKNVKKILLAITLSSSVLVSSVYGMNPNYSDAFFQEKEIETNQMNSNVDSASHTGLIVVAAVILIAMAAANPEPKQPKKIDTIDGGGFTNQNVEFLNEIN